ncbi:MAG: BTAD domain-containing putative transcriptional regulator [Caldilineales bacterium]
MLRIHLFGYLRLFFDDRALTFVALPRALPLWAYLLLNRGQPVAREALAFTLWPDSTEAQARGSLRRHLYDLRRALPEAPADAPWLLVTPQHVQWNPRAPYWLDVAVFEQLGGNAARLAEAIDLYAGPLLPALDEPWLWFERERLHGQYLNLLRQSIAQHCQRGALDAALVDVQRGLADDPLREDFVRERIALQHALGDRSGALQTYRRFAHDLKAELGVPPMAETQDLARLVLQDVPASEVLGDPAAAPPAPRPGNATAPVRSLIGRDETVDEIMRILLAASPPAARLLTLTGPGGVGKTRLAQEVAWRLAQQPAGPYPDGVFAVALAAVQDPALVLATISSTVGAHGSGSALSNLIDHLRYKQMLLVLDNFEHVLLAAGEINALLHAAPGLRLLVTSQAALNLYGEHAFDVASLALPDARRSVRLPLAELAAVPSVALFCEGARAAAPRFELTEDNAADVILLCARLEGMPLAIELAAARSKLFTPAEIVQQLDNTLDALRSRAADVPERHRSLRAAVAWSYGLLDDREKQLFARLALLPGGFTAESVAAILLDGDDGHALEALERLLDKNIVRLSAVKAGPQPRFFVLAVLRAFAEELLAGDDALEALCLRRARYFAGLAGQARAGLAGKEQGAWLDRLAAEENNLRASLAWSLRAGADDEAVGLGVELILGALTEYWVRRARLPEGLAWHQQALALRERLPLGVQSRLLQRTCWYETLQGSYDTARRYGDLAIELARADGSRELLSTGLQMAGLVAGHQGDYDRAGGYFRETIAGSAAGQGEVSHNLAVAYNNLSIVLKHQGSTSRRSPCTARHWPFGAPRTTSCGWHRPCVSWAT